MPKRDPDGEDSSEKSNNGNVTIKEEVVSPGGGARAPTTSASNNNVVDRTKDVDELKGMLKTSDGEGGGAPQLGLPTPTSTWGRGHGIAFIVPEGDVAAGIEKLIRSIAQFMNCDIKVLSVDATPRAMCDFLASHSEWLRRGTYVGLWFVGRGSRKSVQGHGGECLPLSQLLSLTRDDLPLLAFIDCRGPARDKKENKHEALSQSADLKGNRFVAYSWGSPFYDPYDVRDGDRGDGDEIGNNDHWLEALAQVAHGNKDICTMCAEAREALYDRHKGRSTVDTISLLPPWYRAVFASQGDEEEGETEEQKKV